MSGEIVAAVPAGAEGAVGRARGGASCGGCGAGGGRLGLLAESCVGQTTEEGLKRAFGSGGRGVRGAGELGGPRMWCGMATGSLGEDGARGAEGAVGRAGQVRPDESVLRATAPGAGLLVGVVVEREGGSARRKRTGACGLAPARSRRDAQPVSSQHRRATTTTSTLLPPRPASHYPAQARSTPSAMRHRRRGVRAARRRRTLEGRGSTRRSADEAASPAAATPARRDPRRGRPRACSPAPSLGPRRPGPARLRSAARAARSHHLPFRVPGSQAGCCWREGGAIPRAETSWRGRATSRSASCVVLTCPAGGASAEERSARTFRLSLAVGGLRSGRGGAWLTGQRRLTSP